MRYTCLCRIHTYNGVSNYVREEILYVEANSKEEAISNVTSDIKMNYKSRSDISLSSISIDASPTYGLK